MPESPEVAVVVSNLQKDFGGQNLSAVQVIGGRYLNKDIGLGQINFPLHNIQFHCRGKFIWFSFEEPIVFFNHLAMTGSYGKEHNKHAAVKFSFEKDLYFSDPRHFGSLSIQTPQALQEKLATLGWDILTEPAPADIVNRFRKFNKKTIAVALLDQWLVSGSGNYLRSEALFRARVSPFRLVSSLSNETIMDICSELTSLAKQSYAHGGATLATFKNLYGTEGSFVKELELYGKKTDPFGNKVLKVKDNTGRTISYSILQK